MRATVEAAARANAEWCDAVCRSLGLPSAFIDDVWASPERTPAYCPDAVTLKRGVSPEAVLDRVDIETPGCSVKDSFADLDLDAAGFEVRFEAQWLLTAAQPPAPGHPADFAWSRARNASEFSSWETAWVRSAGQAGILRPGLLERSEIRILSAIVEGQVVAGVAANQSGSLVHVSNFFAALPSVEEAWRRCLEAVASEFPDASLVTYESGESLAMALASGFTPIGPLRIWVAER